MTMNCFRFFRVKLTSAGMAVLCAGGLVLSLPQASFAADWMDLLKPLVTNVIVPGASLGMKKFIQHEEKIHPDLRGNIDGSGSTASLNTTGTSTTGADGMSQFMEGNTADSSFTSPEEPISSNTESTAGATYWAASHSVSATDPAPAPPPPVATP